MKFYHATYKDFLGNILEKGLLPNPPHRNWDDSDLQSGVYLAVEPEQAISFAECSELVLDDTIDSGIILIEIELNEDEVTVDPNNQDGNTFIYDGVITEFSRVLSEDEYYELRKKLREAIKEE